MMNIHLQNNNCTENSSGIEMHWTFDISGKVVNYHVTKTMLNNMLVCRQRIGQRNVDKSVDNIMVLLLGGLVGVNVIEVLGGESMNNILTRHLGDCGSSCKEKRYAYSYICMVLCFINGNVYAKVTCWCRNFTHKVSISIVSSNPHHNENKLNSHVIVTPWCYIIIVRETTSYYKQSMNVMILNLVWLNAHAYPILHVYEDVITTIVMAKE